MKAFILVVACAGLALLLWQSTGIVNSMIWTIVVASLVMGMAIMAVEAFFKWLARSIKYLFGV